MVDALLKTERNKLMSKFDQYDTNGKTERVVNGFPMRYFFRYEVEHLLARAGFEVVELYGDYDKSPLVDESPEMIFVARKVSD